jgi:hypothetical protein
LGKLFFRIFIGYFCYLTEELPITILDAKFLEESSVLWILPSLRLPIQIHITDKFEQAYFSELATIYQRLGSPKT